MNYINKENLLATINEVWERRYERSNDKVLYDLYRMVVRRINSAQTADVVEVRHAQWIKRIDPLEWCEDDVDVYYECSNCGCNNYGESPYCPNCGAKMDVAWIDGDYEFCEV
jgi:rubrerythrin